jgi:HSP20 family protein
MSLRGFPRFAPASYHWGPSIARHNDFAPLFSLIDDLTNGEASRRQSNSKQNPERFFAPRFDLKEVKDAYHLEGELPGFDQKDISIEFTDEHTLVVSGRVEIEREEGTRPKAALEAPKEKPAIKETPHRATVEDEEGAATSSSPTDEATELVKQSSSSEQDKQQQQEPEHTYWVSERTSGSFTRSFSFPARVDQDGVKASLKNGILTVAVPKAAAPESRKIAIE